jgi:endonuclease YncB( thermonuclease family)
MRYLLILLMSIPLLVYAKPQYGTVVVSKVISVYDGDTFRVDIDSLSSIAGKNIPIRVNGVDTPEIRGKCQYEKKLAYKAKDFVASMLFKAEKIELVNMQRGKYFRIVADVFVDGVSLEQQLLSNGLAYKYNGKKKLDWCN